MADAVREGWLWRYEWKSGLPASWKGSQKVAVGQDAKHEVEIPHFQVSVEEMRTDPESVEVFAQTCDRVWPVVLQAFIDEKFRPTVSDKDSLLASFEYEGGQTVAFLGTVNEVVRAFTVGPTGFFATWDRFRIDSASLLLNRQPDGGCRAEAEMSFAAFSDGGFRKGWFKLTSNNQFEKRILNATAEKLSRDYDADLDHAISQLPTNPPPAPEPKEKTDSISLSVTSDPAPADIEIDGEYVGSTPSTLTLPSGSHEIVVKKRGFEAWQRSLRFHSGDERPVYAELRSETVNLESEGQKVKERLLLSLPKAAYMHDGTTSHDWSSD